MRIARMLAAGVIVGLLAVGGVVTPASADYTDDCMSELPIGTWIEGQPPGQAMATTVLRNMNSGSPTGRITIVESDWRKMEGWYQGGHRLPDGSWRYQSTLVWCYDGNDDDYIDVNSDPPPAQTPGGGGGGTADLGIGGYSSVWWISSPIWVGTVTVGDPEGVPTHPR